ncbi:MAG: Ig-like domain-containing protein [Planctomycetales bacterium]|nr:Ig-like domain-containing protein [Planctomycetales bacterium]
MTFLAFVCLLAVFQDAFAEPTLRIVRDKSGHAVAFEAEGLDGEKLGKLKDDSLSQLLAVYVLEKGVEKLSADQPSLLGEHKVDEDSLRFTPRFSLLAGNRYRAVLQPEVLEGKKADSKNAVTLDIVIAAPKRTEATVVTQIYPSSNKLPENQLRFYLHFSQPMSKGEAYTHLKLRRKDGQAVELPFLELGEELWDASGKRLTLLIDPGRIKRGLKPREDVGPVLEAGQTYTLVVDASWKDAVREPLKTGFSKKFVVDKPVEVGIDTAAWKLEPPTANTKQPLVVKFPRPLDHALLQRTISHRSSI